MAVIATRASLDEGQLQLELRRSGTFCYCTLTFHTFKSFGFHVSRLVIMCFGPNLVDIK